MNFNKPIKFYILGSNGYLGKYLRNSLLADPKYIQMELPSSDLDVVIIAKGTVGNELFLSHPGLVSDVNITKPLELLSELRNKNFKIIDRIKSVRKHLREINTTVGVFKKQVDTIDMELKELIEMETESIVESSYSVFDEWWDKTIELTENEEDKLTSSELWIKRSEEHTSELQSH